MALISAFSDDSLDPSRSTPSPHDETWSDAPETFETDDVHMFHEPTIPEEEEDVTITPSKASDTSKAHDVHPASPPDIPNPGTMSDVHEEETEQDSQSVQSVPIVQVTEPTSPTLPMTSHSASSVFMSSPTTSLAPTSATAPASTSRDRRRSAIIDGRASNRISGFFSSLIHRREPSTPTRDSPSMPPEPPKAAPHTSSRASSPLPSRPMTPPPVLPPPSLTDLGLSLSTLTAHLSPSHFSSPPSSGAYLSPNYLLLCHAQGLDVLPLASPPAVQPYTLIRRVPFKHVVVMEHRGVLVAIAGRRDGVRVYALDEVRKAIEWRMDVEIKRERDRARREEAKRAVSASHDAQKRHATSKEARMSLFPATPSKDKAARRASISTIEPIVPSPGIPRTPTVKRPKPSAVSSSTPTRPAGPPPAYSAAPLHGTSHLNINAGRTRTTSVNDVLAGTMNRRRFSDEIDNEVNDTKGDWASSDDEAINPAAAPSGSQALDERTSANGTGSLAPNAAASDNRLEVPHTGTGPNVRLRRRRPANLDLSLTRASPRDAPAPATPPPPSPTPTLMTLRQALLASPASSNAVSTTRTLNRHDDQDGDDDDEGEVGVSTPATPTRERISLAEALFESRLPDVPPAGTQQPQEAILLSSVASGDEEAPASPLSSESHSQLTRRSASEMSNRRRRRWSVWDGIFQPSSSHASQSSIHTVAEGPASRSIVNEPPPPLPPPRERTLSRSQSTRMPSGSSTPTARPSSSQRPSTAPGREASTQAPPPLPALPALPARFIPRIITALSSRRSEDRQPATPKTAVDIAKGGPAPNGQVPAPKLEYVKLPGTKGSVMVKAVETAKKSFLAILCGDNGEKVELFAGTYRTALGLSRTFILPDSPRSLELQLQGDDLVEVFLVFSQNVFGLEPATVRVREVRIGRAERRAARRRVREGTRAPDQQNSENADGENGGDGADGDGDAAPPTEEDTHVNVSISMAIAPSSPLGEEPQDELAASASLSSPNPSVVPTLVSDTPPINSEAANATDELLAMAAASASPYSTFQQLSFAPRFPLAAIADEYVIPPTYPSFLEYRKEFEPDVDGQPKVDLSQTQFSPPGLPVPIQLPPCRWFYKDPKGIIHGPWKASLMQAWYQDGLLPPELPVRREEDTDYLLLKDLRLQSIDPTHPFRSSPPPPTHTQAMPLPLDESKPLLQPISLLRQPRLFGPPALFYSTRGGHSTAIVDARGRSVLKNRFQWSPDDAEYDIGMRLGDVKRLEAFDVEDRAVLVAMRQGGLEAVDFGDALLRPADFSRTVYPTFNPPLSSINRRGAYIWRIGTPISSSAGSSPVVGLPSKFPAHRLQPKKQSTGPAKSPARSDFYPNSTGDVDASSDEEMLFLARRNDEIFMCERRTGSFRILRLTKSEN
ncbi:hypothetical protein EIP91_001422 [Steccherinum ochraceum]|uniref:GYF domain-containing protein n=1 Tax=Steccherinum ochraceum TaxID=92696 RepID=A0A4R0RHV0_9APHY|nr:hypothetical protein EIP91_001422 [Steccherinum ochraceum]